MCALRSASCLVMHCLWLVIDFQLFAGGKHLKLETRKCSCTASGKLKFSCGLNTVLRFIYSYFLLAITTKRVFGEEENPGQRINFLNSKCECTIYVIYRQVHEYTYMHIYEVKYLVIFKKL